MQKNILKPYHLISSGDMTGNITSAATSVRYVDNIAIQLVYTGTPTGTFTVEATVDGSTWTALDFGSAISASGAAGNQLLNINQAPFDQVRVKYTASLGSGSLQVYIMAKEV